MVETRSGKAKGKKPFLLKGKVVLEDHASGQTDFKLCACAFDRAGRLLGHAAVNDKGAWEVELPIEQPQDVELLVGPAGEPGSMRKSSAWRQLISADQLKERVLVVDIALPHRVWWPWRPVRICISGHVRKLGDDGVCPVPFAKVEIFDVDREGCLWPPLLKWRDLLKKRPVIRLPDLLTDPPLPPIPEPFPRPLPDPPVFGGPFGRSGALPEFSADSLAQPRPASGGSEPESTEDFRADAPVQLRSARRVGELAEVAPAIQQALEHLTITSKIPPWRVYPLCFYSREEVCETVTDQCGYFRCCFTWFPFRFRNGRLRYDARPDIIVKVTQVINGVPRVIYLDPYSSIRWNVTHAHIDLYLDDEDIICGSCDDNERPGGTQTFFTRVGNDEVYQIDQSSGLWQQGSLSNVAYGSTLNVHAQFGDTLSRHVNVSGATPPYYYRLSYRRGNSGDFIPLSAELSDTRVDKVSLLSESATLGPQTVNGTPGLYLIRDFGNYYWYNPDWIGRWATTAVEPDTGTYTLRLEVFDSTGAHLTSSVVDYRDGTVPPPAVLPSMTDRCDLLVRIDNKPPVVDLQVPAVINDCGVIPWSPGLTLNFVANVSQENGRLRGWGLRYTKGVSPVSNTLASSWSANGTPASVNQTVSGASLLSGLDSTCAFALELWAYAHVRNGYGFIYYREQDKAIAIEKCS